MNIINSLAEDSSLGKLFSFIPQKFAYESSAEHDSDIKDVFIKCGPWFCFLSRLYF